ncbi:L-type lectin-domain containing receptor kinase IV.2-like [Curcuma longa]|uniref:L-type lectin-domain containing receptor kinase IV.2-like n=1 Tax=Curcuma longa TaxID=136217 RepID=UPI003D9EBC6E
MNNSSVSLVYSLLFFSICLSAALATEFLFNGFRDAAKNLSMDGAALITSNGVLQITNDSMRQIGHAFFSSPVLMLKNESTSSPARSFSTTFVFNIITYNGSGGHGIAFVVAPSIPLREVEASQYLGLLDEDNNGDSSNHLFAIEFDTKAHGQFADINDNHVGVDINNLSSVVAVPAAYQTDELENVSVNLLGGEPIQAWIDYDGAVKVLNVTIAPFMLTKPHRPLISWPIDLSPIFKEYMYVGFSSATGKVMSYHYVLGWSFSTNESAPNLTLSELPLPLRKKVNSPTTSRFFTVKVVLVSSLITLVFVLFLFLVSKFLQNRRKLLENLEDWELDYPNRFPYKELYRATRGFKETEVLGSGGFGKVYRGTLWRTEKQVAIKKISNTSSQGVREFIAELSSLGQMRHRNIVQLLGWCKRNEDLLLVYDYMPNGSLDTFLFNDNKSTNLSWNQRFKILKDIAFGLVYLHEDWEQVVVHRDIKSSNVLLDVELNGRLGDFGLARLYEHGKNPHTTHIVGTVGYISPELSHTGKATTGSDVFAYGILLFEVASGRRPIEHTAPSTQVVLIDWVRECHTMNKLLTVVDPRLNEHYDKEEMELVLKLGLLCSQSTPEARPTMRQVTQYLSGNDILSDDVAFVFSEKNPLDLSYQLRYTSSSKEVMSSTSLSQGR